MARTSTKEVAKVEPQRADLEKASPRIVEMVESITSTLVVEDKFEVSLSILDRILSAENEEDVFAGLGTVDHARDQLMNIPIEVTEVTWNASTFEGETSFGFYAIFQYVNLYNGEKRTATVGSLNCMAQLYALDKLKKLPYQVVLATTERPTASGFYPLFFRPISEDDRERIAERAGIIDAEVVEPF